MKEQPTKTQKDKSKVTKEEWREYTKTVWHIANTSDPNHPAVFPVEIPRRLIKLFSFYGETVLDPFGGTGTTAIAAIDLGRRCICIEQNPDYACIIRDRCHDLLNGKEHAQVILGDSRNMELLAENSVGLVITSPPYWNKADYGKGSENIGNEPVYPRFFDKIRPVFEECFRVLKPGRKLCLVTANVNQHTEHGLLTFPLAADFINLLRDIGFVLINEIVWSKDGTGGKWGSYGKQRPIFGSYPYPPNFLFKNVHEYIVIVAKPPENKANGKTVIAYEYLIGRSKQPKPKNRRKGR
ncbi:MAG: site-specific DNA-methyltransferase [Deltaproteobacteria bacterium]|nr:site-specific DNA-methyltransferase [Deltaproteobacteria bacterium]